MLTVTSWPRLITFVAVVLLLISAIVASIVWFVRREPTQPDVAGLQSSPAPTPTPNPNALQAIILQEDLARNQRRLIQCSSARCQPLPQLQETEEAVTDGQNWYFYSDKADGEEGSLRTLLRRNSAGEEQTIIEETKLTEPRELIMSPDGQKLAFWLDNIDQPEKNLTELWMYDAAAGGTKVVAEKLVKTDVLTRARWNQGSSHLWFLADSSAEPDAEKIELVLVQTQPPQIAAAFPTFDWNAAQEVVAREVMDVSADANNLVLTRPKEGGQSELVVLRSGQKPQITGIPGRVPFARWIKDGSLIYAVQDAKRTSFWRVRGSVHSFIAGHDGTLQSARADDREEHILFVSKVGQGSRWLSLHTTSGSLEERGEVPTFGTQSHIVRVIVDEPAAAPATTADSSRLDDDQIVAFLERQTPAIAENESAQAYRIITTSETNTAYVDYTTQSQGEHRLLVSIQDAIYHEWSILARYQPAGGEWRKESGNPAQDPPPVRIYEWEDATHQWILKQEFFENYLQIESAL